MAELMLRLQKAALAYMADMSVHVEAGRYEQAVFMAIELRVLCSVMAELAKVRAALEDPS
jgi:hypothetical protein